MSSADFVPLAKQHHADGDHRQRGRAEEVMAGHRAAEPVDPVAPPDQHHAQVEHHEHDGDEVGDARQADHAAAEVGELLADAPVFDGQRGLVPEG